MRRLLALPAVLVLAVSGALLPARAEPATFTVGFAVRNIEPGGCMGCRPEGQFLGGFGYDDPVTVVHDDDSLEVRAMAISNGTKTVELAIVDTQGWFSGNQEGPWGNRDARVNAASALGITSGDIIISSTHSHAAPTIMGIWGSTDPAYLQYVHDQTVDALVAAGSTLRPAELLAAEADIGDTIISGVAQYDGYQGWRVDGDTPVLWARDPATKATLGLYANVPVHADIVNGVGLDLMSADHIGVERRLLDADLGGTSVIAMGTLGRQEATVQTDGLAAAGRVGSHVANEIERALAHATPITDGTVASAEQYVLVPGTNPLLAALNYGNAAPGCPCDVAGVAWTIDRALTPPYLAGGAFGTWITALRIGDLVYASQPGEAFPETSTAISRAFGGDVDVRIVGMAQDQLGYYYPPEAYPFTFINPSDHQIYNASLLIGEVNVQAHALNAQALGLTPMPNHETIQWDDPQSILEAGVQWFPTRREGAAPTVELTAYTSEPGYTTIDSGLTLDNIDVIPGECPTSVSWSFGGATSSGGCGQIVSHTFAGPGTYEVTASTIDPRTGNTVTWTGTLIVNEPLAATVSVAGDVLTAGVVGGQGTILAAHWSFDDATTAHGLTVTKPGGHGIVEVVDGAGNHATTTF